MTRASAPSGHRRKVLIGTIGAAIVLASLAAGFLMASAFQSPAQREAAAQPPAKRAVVAKVLRGDLDQTISINATVTQAQNQNVAIAGSSGTVTGNPVTAGATYGAGSRLVEVNGAPVFIMPGSFPLYRSMTFGDHGPDVRQLQEGLNASGFDLTADGVFGSTTEQAVRLLFTRLGYDVPATDGGGSADSPTSAETPAASKGRTSTDKSSTTDAAPTASNANATSEAPSEQKPATHVLLPPSAVVIVNAVPARAASSLPVGTTLSADTTVSIASGAPTVEATAPSANLVGLTVGQEAKLQLGDGKTESVQVSAVGTAGSDGNQTATFAGPGLTSDQVGKSGTLDVTLQSAARDSLIVPTTAIITTGDSNRAYVLVQSKNGDFRRVQVQETATLNGQSAITATDGDVSAGDLVEVR